MNGSEAVKAVEKDDCGDTFSPTELRENCSKNCDEVTGKTGQIQKPK